MTSTYYKRKLVGDSGRWPPEDCGEPLVWPARGGKMEEKEIREEFNKAA